ncbi:MAG TPA: hypothetical protein VGC51_09740 [Hansschlegelia sp.]
MSDTLPGGSDTSALNADIAALKDDVSRLTDTISTLLADGAATARSAAREGVDKAAAVAGDAKERAVAAADDLSATIEQNPLTSVLIALGVGYVVGALGRSRR